MIAATDLFRSILEPELSQGDIVEVCPVGALPKLRVVRTYKDDKDQPQQRATAYVYNSSSPFKNPPAPPLFGRDGRADEVVFAAKLRRCVVISDNCVALAKASNQGIGFDKPPNGPPWHVAPLEDWPKDSELVPIGGGKQAKLGAMIEAGRVKRYMGVPALTASDGKTLLPLSYIDFRHITPIRPEVFESVTRVASMTELGVGLLWARVFTYFSGKYVEDLACPKCGHSLTLVEGLEAAAAKKASVQDAAGGRQS